jgi:hypothetical protein
MTKKKIAHPKRSTKTATRRTARRVQKPEDSRPPHGTAHANPVDAEGLTADDRAALASLERVSNAHVPIATTMVKGLREKGASGDQVARALRGLAYDLEYVADHVTPAPETREAMLTDALGVVEAAALIFESVGDQSDLLGEALRSASDDFELFEHAGTEMSPMAYLRAQYRIRLALKLAAFRAKHPTWTPAKAEKQESDGEQAAGGAS